MIYRSILCVTDESESLGRTAAAAGSLSKLAGIRLILLYVVEKWHNSDLVVTDSAEWKNVRDTWLGEGRQLLDRKEELLRSAGVYSIKKELRSGEKAYETVATAIEQNVSVIVAANYRSFSMRGLLANSFAKKLIEHTPCPILWVNE